MIFPIVSFLRITEIHIDQLTSISRSNRITLRVSQTRTKKRRNFYDRSCSGRWLHKWTLIFPACESVSRKKYSNSRIASFAYYGSKRFCVFKSTQKTRRQVLQRIFIKICTQGRF